MLNSHKMLAAAGLLVAAAAVYLSAPPDATAPSPIIGAPTLDEIQGGVDGATPFRRYENGFVCDMYIYPDTKNIRFRWKYAPNYQWGDVPIESNENVAIRFWPNYLEWLNGTELLVAGIAPSDGATVIELWTFEAESPQLPSYEIIQGTAGPVEVWGFPKRTSVRKVFESKDPLTARVSFAKENIGAPDKVFLKFSGAGILYELDYSSQAGALAVIASEVSMPGVLHIPELGNTGPWRIGGAGVEHDTDGFIYGLFTDTTLNATPISIYFLDVNMDGIIEGYTASDLTGHYFGALVRVVH